MQLRAGVLSHPKRGNSADENEDVYGPDALGVDIQIPFVCAISDGAAETSFSALWARLMVEAFVEVAGDKNGFVSRIPGLRNEWDAKIKEKTLPWYAEEKVSKGAFATLLGLTITHSNDTSLRWNSIAVGDSCLFHVRGNHPVSTFPATTVAQLRERPNLLSSRTEANPDGEGLLKTQEGEFFPGDRLFLVTDALAAWIFASIDDGLKPFDQIDQMLRTTSAYPQWLEHLWESRSLKNDDCTILWIEALT